ncbi:hypothetical protein GF406_22035 [candidate division KSB1 bacterium]|nr:hypothetical protein [candidate division KSB1 bacterium]
MKKGSVLQSLSTLKGLVTATHTPMHTDGSLNIGLIGKQVDYLIGSGVNGLFIIGTTGEFPSLTLQERMQATEEYIKVTDHRIPVIVHIGHNCLRESRILARHALESGADAVGFAPPSYFKPANEGALLSCCKEIMADTPELPFFYYHIPEITGVHLSIKSFLTIADMPNLAGIKYTLETMGEFLDCIDLFKDRYTMMFGRDEMMLSALAAGGDTFVGSTYNYAAPLYHRLIDAFKRGDLAAARMEQARATRFIDVQVKYGGVRASKMFMKFLGIDCGPVRLPLSPFTLDKEKQFKQELTALGFFDWYC